MKAAREYKISELISIFWVIFIAVAIAFSLDGIEIIIRAIAFFRNKSKIIEFRSSLGSRKFSGDNFSILMPAYKNHREVKLSISKLIEMGIPPEKILVIDDFSDDQFTTATEAANLGIRVISANRNSKKVGAINLGIKAVETDFVIIIDSDTCFVNSYSRLKEAIEEMQKLGLDAMAGRVLPCGSTPQVESKDLFSKKSSWLLNFQWLEYDQAMRLGRGAMYALQKEGPTFKVKYAEVSLISGAFGIFRRTSLESALEKFQDREESFLGEDLERTWKLLSNNAKVGYSDDLIILTSAPLDMARHFKQRVFWAQGLFRCVFSDFGWALTKKKISGAAYGMSLIRDVLLQPLRLLSIILIFTNPIGFLSILLFYLILNIIVTKKVSQDLHPSNKSVFLLPFYRFYISNIPTTIGFLRGALHFVNLYLRPSKDISKITIAKEWKGKI